MAPTYASAQDYADYTGTELATGPALAALNLELEKAERDVDDILGPIQPATLGGLKFDPATLADAEALALARAVCAQAVYVAGAGGEEGLNQRLKDRVKGPDYEVQYAEGATGTGGTRVRLSPRVKVELGPIEHLRRLGGFTR